jgi:hypothetical protein
VITFSHWTPSSGSTDAGARPSSPSRFLQLPELKEIGPVSRARNSRRAITALSPAAPPFVRASSGSDHRSSSAPIRAFVCENCDFPLLGWHQQTAIIIAEAVTTHMADNAAPRHPGSRAQQQQLRHYAAARSRSTRTLIARWPAGGAIYILENTNARRRPHEFQSQGILIRTQVVVARP